MSRLRSAQAFIHPRWHRRRESGATLVEVLTVLFLVSVGFALVFEVLRGYLQQHRRILGQMQTVGSLIELRDFFLVHLTEGTKGESLRPARGGAFPVGRLGGTGPLVGQAWLDESGRRLWVLERIPEGVPGTLVYVRGEGTTLELIVSGVAEERYSGASLALISGLPAPAEWEGTADEPPVVGSPYNLRGYGYLVRVVNSRAAQPSDIPASEADAEKLRASIDFSRCRWLDTRIEPLPELGLPRPAATLLETTREGVRNVNRRLRVCLLAGMREVSLTMDGGLTTRFQGGAPSTLLSPGALRSDARFRYIGPDLHETVARPLLKNQVGISFSGTYLSPDSGLPYPVYLPLVVEEWLPVS